MFKYYVSHDSDKDYFTFGSFKYKRARDKFGKWYVVYNSGVINGCTGRDGTMYEERLNLGLYKEVGPWKKPKRKVG